MQCCMDALFCYIVSLAICICSVLIWGDAITGEATPFSRVFIRSDARHYHEIADHGYSLVRNDRSNVAFFPAYPLAAWTLSRIAGTTTAWSLVIVAHFSLLGAYALLSHYVQGRFATPSTIDTGAPAPGFPNPGQCILLLFTFFPTTAFCRMAYAESMFVFVSLLALHAFIRRWPLPVVSVIVGALTCVRPIGIAAVVPLMIYTWKQSDSTVAFVRRAIYVAPTGTWGLATYMLYLFLRFDDALAFARVQKYWDARPDHDSIDKLFALGTLEPVWAVYVPGAPEYWRQWSSSGSDSYLSNLQFMTPFYFTAVVVLVCWGAWKRQLNVYEVTLAAGMIGIPYVTRAYENCFLSQARFASIVLPFYFVAGKYISKMPPVAVSCIFVILGFFLAFYFHQIAAEHLFF
jgi:hypothetical protein